MKAPIVFYFSLHAGIDAVKSALRAGIAVGNEDVPIKVNLIAPPLYVVTTSTPEKAVRGFASKLKS